MRSSVSQTEFGFCCAPLTVRILTMNFCAGLAVLAFLFASCLVTESEGIQCYKCALCNDPFESSGKSTVECAGSCVKAKVSSGVTRACSPIKVDTACEEESSIEACACNSDLCNSSSIPTFSISVAVMMFALRYMMKFAL